MRRWPWQRWTTAVLGTTVTALLIGVPTGVVRSPFYTRMTPVLWWNYPVWALSATFTGLILATYVQAPAALPTSGTRRMGAGGILSAFAVGCPICNKLVVALIGLSGALNVWAPIQPFLGAVSLALLAFALLTRLRAQRSCSLPAANPRRSDAALI